MPDRDRTTPELEDVRARTLAELELQRVEHELDAPEYERRVDLARRARSETELEALRPTPSLPAAPPLRELVSADEERDSVVAILTGANRKGSWEPPQTLRVLSVMGGVNLDFRQAELLDGVTEVEVTAIMGGVDIIVPPGADVHSNGFALMGEFTHLSHRSPHPDSPALRIRGFSLMGGVTVKVKS
ncbi:MAG: LiaF domain-containing protein [Myxococcota bacterium]